MVTDFDIRPPLRARATPRAKETPTAPMPQQEMLLLETLPPEMLPLETLLPATQRAKARARATLAMPAPVTLPTPTL
jgi:hypothetical protein